MAELELNHPLNHDVGPMADEQLVDRFSLRAAAAEEPEPEDGDNSESELEEEDSDSDGEAGEHDLSGIEDIPSSPPCMDLSQQEANWAWNIKAAIEANPEVDNLRDFMYAQLALSVENDVGLAVEKALHLQHFREEYEITDTVEEGHKAMQDFMELMPGMFLAFTYYASGEHYTLIYDLAAFDCGKVHGSTQGARILMVGLYYCSCALTPDFSAIRNGTVMLCESAGFDWTKNLDLKTCRKVYVELLNVYPIYFQKFRYFNSGIFLNMLQSMKKRFLPAKITDKIETGCLLPGGAWLPSLYLVPTPEAASERFCNRIAASLKKRQDNELEFNLPAP